MPSQPTVTISADNTEGCIEIVINNPSTNPTHNDVWRYEASQSLSAAIKIGANVRADGSFADYGVGSGISYNYFVRAVDGSDTADSAIASASVTLSLLHVHAPVKYVRTSNKGSNQVRLTNILPETLTRSRASSEYIQGGRTKPIVGTGRITEGVLSFTARETTASQIRILRELYRLAQTLCWRDQAGNVIYGTMESLPPKFHAKRKDVVITVRENDYSPAITASTILAEGVDALLLTDGFGLLGVGGGRILLSG
jgi:hypothetical protein